MKAKGIRILDKKNRVVSVKLSDVLEEIQHGDLLHWSILYLDAAGNLGGGRSIPLFEKQIQESERGLFIEWNHLNSLSKKLYEIIDIIIIGCKDKSLLRRYDSEQEMYETCDISINMFDSCFWEVFSKNKDLINRLATKFTDIKYLEADFER